MMTQGFTATLVAATLAISRSSLYYQKRPRGSRADRTYDEQIVMACGEKLAYGYRRVAWWLQRKKGLAKNRGWPVKRARCYWLLLAEEHLNRRRLGAMLGRIVLPPVPTASKDWGKVSD